MNHAINPYTKEAAVINILTKTDSESELGTSS
jgi:hypothetical protein